MHIIYRPDQEKESHRETEIQRRRLPGTYKTTLFFVVLLFVMLGIWLVLMFTPNRIGAEINSGPYENVLSTSASDDRKEIVHVILPGETLWKLADRYGDLKQDKREWIQHIKNVNDLQHSTLFIGDTLVIPMNELK